MQQIEISVEDLPQQIRKAGHQLKFKEVIGKSAYGLVCLYESIKSQKFAIKFEHSKSPIKKLLQESLNLKKIHEKNQINAYSQTRVIMIPYDKKELKRFRDLSLKMFEAVKSLHQANYIHRDIKPDNFRINDEKVYLVDLGSCKAYIDDYGKHIKWNDNQVHRGTLFTASISAHDNNEVARIDDLISLIYSLMMLTGEKLPWDDNPTTSQMYNGKRIQDLKKELKAEYFQYDVNKRLFEILQLLEKQLYTQFQGVDVDYEAIEALLTNINQKVLDQFRFQNIINNCKIVINRNKSQIQNKVLSFGRPMYIPQLEAGPCITQISIYQPRNYAKLSNLGNLENIALKTQKLEQQVDVITLEIQKQKRNMNVQTEQEMLSFQQTNTRNLEIISESKKLCVQSQVTGSYIIQAQHDGGVAKSAYCQQSVNETQEEDNVQSASTKGGLHQKINLVSGYFERKDKEDKYNHTRNKQGQPITKQEDFEKLELKNSQYEEVSSMSKAQDSQTFEQWSYRRLEERNQSIEVELYPIRIKVSIFIERKRYTSRKI
eukprot:403376044